MLNKLYEQGKDLHVANYMAYGKTADHKLYADAAFKKTVTEAEIKDAFQKGRLIIVEGANCLWYHRRCDRDRRRDCEDPGMGSFRNGLISFANQVSII